MAQKYIVNRLEGIYKDESGTPIDAAVIYANSEVIADVGGIATGIPTILHPGTTLEHGFLLNTDNFDIYSLYVNPRTGLKKWKKVQV